MTAPLCLWVGPASLAGGREVAMLRGRGVCVAHAAIQDETGASVEIRQADAPCLSPDDLDRIRRWAARPSAGLAPWLREHVRSIVVETDPRLFGEYIRAFAGPITFRSYGHATRLSDALWGCGVTYMMLARRNLSVAAAFAGALAIEESWVREIGIAMPGAQVWTDDTYGLRWQDGCAKPMVAIAGGIGDADQSRRQRLLLDDLCAAHPHAVSLLEPQLSGLAGQSPLRAADLEAVTQTAGLLQIDAATGFIPAHVLQACAAGVPIVFLDGGLLARVLPDSPGYACDLQAALDLARRLAKGDAALGRAIVSGQRALAAMLDPAAGREAFGRMIPLLDKQDDGPPGLPDLGSPDLNWVRLDRLLTALSTAPAKDDDLVMLYRLLLQRDPYADEMAEHRAVMTAHGAEAVVKALLRGREGASLWPDNRFRAWLQPAGGDDAR